MKRPASDCDYNAPRTSIFGRPSQSFIPGQRCWLLTDNDDQSLPYSIVTIQSVNANIASVNVPNDPADSGGIRNVDVSYLLDANDTFHHADAAEMAVLNYPNVLENVKQRFTAAANSGEKRHWIYTYAGWILFAVNPYAPCSEIYQDQWCDRYFRKTITQEDPHPFAIASVAFTKLISDKKPQYILISGESGGGKTECSKHTLRYLTWVTRRQRRLRGRQSIGGPGDAAERLAELLIAANPLLEFFGNAKTARNDNSSRFGKLFRIFYDDRGEHLLSAQLSTYLLAKSRVVQIPDGEENYHVFHSLMAGMSPAMQQLLKIDTATFTSPFLGKGASCDFYAENGTFHLDRLTSTLEEFGLASERIVEILQVLASILHLGNLKFEYCPDKTNGETRIANHDVFDIIANLWQMEGTTERLEEVLTSKQIRDTRSHLSPEQSKQMTLSLAKGLYEVLFDYVVALVRQKLDAADTTFGLEERMTAESQNHCVGVLDLFGFENMEPGSDNGFEQLCINYANEQLHYHFLRQVIEYEKEIYQLEGIVLNSAVFTNCAQLLSSDALNILLGVRGGGKAGIFAILEDVSRLGGVDRDGMFCRRANQAILDHKLISSPQKRRKAINEATISAKFSINHFAENVVYTAEGFSERNQDHISEELRDFLTNSAGSHIRILFPSDENTPPTAAKRASRSLSATFIKQMKELISGLEQTSCYFIKCLKSNDNQRAYQFDSRRVLSQLVTGGVGPVLELMKEGYPCRLSYDTLWTKYKDFLPQKLLEQMNPRDFAQLTTNFLGIAPDQYRLGITRIFFRFGALQSIESILNDLDDSFTARFASEMHKFYVENKFKRVVSVVLVRVRMGVLIGRARYRRVAKQAARHYLEVYLPNKRHKAAKKIQRFWTDICRSRIAFFRLRRSFIRIQRAWRAVLLYRRLMAEAQWHQKLRGAQLLQSLLLRRKYQHEANCLRITKAAIHIQAAWRGYWCRRELLEEVQENAATVIQRWWRECQSKAELTMCEKRCTTPLSQHLHVLRPKASCLAFKDTKDFWEIATAAPHLDRSAIGEEVRRRRRSLFCTGQIPTPSRHPHFAARVADNLLTNRQTSIATPPRDSRPDRTDGPTDSFNSSHPKSRRCIESGVRFGGLDSASVVDIFARVYQPTPRLPTGTSTSHQDNNFANTTAPPKNLVSAEIQQLLTVEEGLDLLPTTDSSQPILTAADNTTTTSAADQPPDLTLQTSQQQTSPLQTSQQGALPTSSFAAEQDSSAEDSLDLSSSDQPEAKGGNEKEDLSGPEAVRSSGAGAATSAGGAFAHLGSIDSCGGSCCGLVDYSGHLGSSGSASEKEFVAGGGGKVPSARLSVSDIRPIAGSLLLRMGNGESSSSTCRCLTPPGETEGYLPTVVRQAEAEVGGGGGSRLSIRAWRRENSESVPSNVSCTPPRTPTKLLIETDDPSSAAEDLEATPLFGSRRELPPQSKPQTAVLLDTDPIVLIEETSKENTPQPVLQANKQPQISHQRAPLKKPHIATIKSLASRIPSRPLAGQPVKVIQLAAKKTK